MKFVVKQEDYEAFDRCSRQMITETGLCGFAYEEDFKPIAETGVTEFLVAESSDVDIAFRDLGNQIANLSEAENVYFFISAKAAADAKITAEKFDSYLNEMAILLGDVNFYYNVYEADSETNTLYVFVNKHTVEES